VNNWWQVLVHWMHIYLAEPRVRSIYRLRGRWRVNLGWRGGGRRRKGHWRTRLVTFTMAALRRSPGMHDAIHCDVVLRLSTWRTGCKRPTAARLIPTDRRASGYGELSRDRARVDPGAKIFTLLSYPLVLCTNRSSRRELQRRGRRRRASLR
jgi:hypothetical protein